MSDLAELLHNNRAWAANMRAQDSKFFENLLALHPPQYLWIGCSDSRVPANQIVGMSPGEVFVHRNVANIVSPGDLNCLTAIQYAVDVLKVRHIILCGHYGCEGVNAVLNDRKLGLADNWLEHICDVKCRHEASIESTPRDLRWDMLCELNVVEQLRHVALSSIVQEAWKRGQDLSLHGWIYGIEDGIIRDLCVSSASDGEFAEAYEAALKTITGPRSARQIVKDKA